MRFLLAIVIAAAAGWSGYWLIGSRGVENGLRDWLDGRAKAGWVANYASVDTRGFPNRLDTTITDLELADPSTGVAWSAPVFQLLRLSYKPNHVIAVWPGEQTVATPLQRVTIESDKASGSFIFKPGTDFELDRSAIVFNGIRLSSTKGWSSEIAEGLLATRPSAARADAVDIGFELSDLRPASPALAQLAEAGFLPDTVEQLKIDATLTFDAPWDRQAVEARRPAVTEIELNLLQARWGQLDLWAAGDLRVNAAGLASGSITVKARNWREMLQIATASGWIPESFVGTLESGLALLAQLSGSPKTLDAPLTFKNGQVSFGPIPLGSLPPLRLR